MLEEFKYIDTIVYRQLYNGLKKLSHAYLFNLNNNVYAEDMIMSFVKSIMCKYHTDKEEYNNLDFLYANIGMQKGDIDDK